MNLFRWRVEPGIEVKQVVYWVGVIGHVVEPTPTDRSAIRRNIEGIAKGLVSRHPAKDMPIAQMVDQRVLDQRLVQGGTSLWTVGRNSESAERSSQRRR